MRSFLVLAVLLSAAGARAEEFFDCKLNGQSDSVSLFGVPKRLRLEEARVWYFREDGKSLKNFKVSETRTTVTVTYTSKTGANFIQSRYVFDRSRCDNYGKGSAVLSRKLVPSAPGSSTSLYSCECGVD